jgi:predicted N-acetyltransferase YhbS
MAITVRPADVADTEKCGDILYRAFQTIAENHNFPCDVPSVEAATGMLAMLVADPGFYGIVAEHDGQIVGSSFADQRSRIAGIGPISVDPETQHQGVGRTLMQAVVDHFTARDFPGIRLVQTAYHNRSLCLYTTIGFQTREPLSVRQGPPLNIKFAGYDVRPATEADVPACNLLARRVHGFDRGVELSEAIAAKTAMVVERLGQITGYASDIGFTGHAVAETNQDLKVLIGAAPAFPGPGFLLPTRNHDVFAWCLENRLRLVMQMTLMTIGLYNEPSGAWLPSIRL